MKVVRLSLWAAGLLALAALLWTGVNGTGEAQAQTGAADKQKLAADAVEILKAHCFECHGKDPKKLKADLDLFNAKHLKENNRVVPGKPDESELIKRIKSADATEVMPPPGKKNPVPAEKLKTLSDWIEKAGGELPSAAPTTPTPPVMGPKLELSPEVREVLVHYCSECHGKDREKRKGGLTIDDPEDLALRKRAIADKPENTLLVQRLQSTDREEMMPKPGAKHFPMPEDKKKIVYDWIKGLPAGAARTIAGEQEPPPPSTEQAAHDILQARCTVCHGGAKAEAGFRILDPVEELQKTKIIVPGEPGKSKLIQRIREGKTSEHRMPQIPQPELSPKEIAALEGWVKGGAKPWSKETQVNPQQFGEEYILRTIRDDIRRLSDDNKRVDYYRYLSLNHLLGRGVTEYALKAHREALTFVLNSLSWEANFERPEPIEDKAVRQKTIFRINIEKLGWTHRPYEDAGGKSAPCNLYDLVLLDYPYGVVLPQSNNYKQLCDMYLMPGGKPLQVRPLPYVRADWFVNVVSRPPLYEDILQLPMTLGELDTLLGVDRKRMTLRGGTPQSGVSRNNRIIERHSPRRSAYFWESYDFRSNRGQENMFMYPVGFSQAGGEMIFALNNNLQAYFVTDGKGVRLEAAPTEVVTDPHASDKTVRNGYACMRCHEGGMRWMHDAVEPALRQLRTSPSTFDLDYARELYRGQAELDLVLEQDRKRFQLAVKELFQGTPPDSIRNTLDLVSTTYLDQEVNLRTASAELGMLDVEELRRQCRTPDLAALGLLSLANRGVVRRDAWEAYFSQVVDRVGSGVPMVPLDGLSVPNYQGANSQSNFTISTDRKTYRLGDKYTMTIKNHGKMPIYVELIGTSGHEGRMAMVNKHLKGKDRNLLVGGLLKIDAANGKVPGTWTSEQYDIRPPIGKDLLTAFACEEPFECGQLLEMKKDGDKGMYDRVIHPQFHCLPDKRKGAPAEFDPRKLVKKTVEITTEN